MNRLSVEERADILTALGHGQGVQATCRLTGTSKNTVLKLLSDVGEACASDAEQRLRALPLHRICVEATSTSSDIWTFCAFEPDTRLVLCWQVGDRTRSAMDAFVANAAARLQEPAEITTDSLADFVGAPSLPGGPFHPARRTAVAADKLKKHLHAVSLHFMVHNFVTAHPLLGRSPAMAAGLAPALWTMKDIVRLAEGRDPDGSLGGD